MTKPRLAVLACGVTLAVTGCTNIAGTNPSGSASPSSFSSLHGSDAAGCADVAALHASVDKLRNVTVDGGAADEIKADIATVKADLSTFIEDAHGRWQLQTDALRVALATLETAVIGLDASPGPVTVSTVRAALSGVGIAAQNLYTAVQGTCASASPSTSG
jgi:outer membrane scaffolding protein for murein synthesis (MipA/OmpV family)